MLDDVTPGLDKPLGIAVFGIDADSLIVTDPGNNRVLGLCNIDTIRQNISVVATEWAPGQNLNVPPTATSGIVIAGLV